MSRTHQRWTLLILVILAVVLAACQPSATPTPTTRPTATEVPPTAAAAGTSESASTVEPTTASVSLDATLAPIVAQSPTPTIAATTEEATEMVAASTEAATAMVAASTEAATAMVAASTEVATMAPTEEMTSMAASTEAATAMVAASTEAATMAPTEEMTMAATAEATAPLGNIIDVAKADGNFTTLLAALDKAKLTTILEGDGPFTVFAPTDAAFKALLASTNMTAADLLSNPDLAKILEYHVIPAKVTADDFAEYKSKDNPDLIVVPTFDGTKTLSVVIGSDGTITINGTAKVILKDVQASNGVIHVIDTVLMPPTAEATAEATASS